ncbi:hypothetical protein [Syntrophorhabdus aromaticivorans]|uniref:hypothetical protein n=1 Tax=Syntrophorhabdus aromaticivorans TaxID=328301 RepID=UPI000419B7BB|nr:hypothetical protein [Syntrophorhabdus aromaticivorans]
MNNSRSTRFFLLTALSTLIGLWVTATCCYGAALATGEITSAIIFQERLHLTVGDKAVTNLGMRAGLVKGDILSITTRLDATIEKPIGECAVTRVDPNSSVCEILSANMEVERGCKVSAPTLKYSMANFYPMAYKLLFGSVDPYAAHEKVTVYIHNIFDNQNNTTKLSQRVKQELINIFAQKKKVHLQQGAIGKKEVRFHPGVDDDNHHLVSELMRTLEVDVFLTGFYTLAQDKINFTFYKYDRLHGDQKLTFQMALAPGAPEFAEAKEIAVPYSPVPRKEYVSCTLAYRSLQYTPQKDERKEIIAREAGKDVFKTYELRRTAFNIISPVDPVIKVDDQDVGFAGKAQVPIILTKGTHKLAVSFKRGYFFNTKDSLLYVSDKCIEKEALLAIQRDGAYEIEALLNPSFDGDNIKFSVYNVSEKKRQVLKGIVRTEATKTVEFFKD